jgi:hypothetical protein
MHNIWTFLATFSDSAHQVAYGQHVICDEWQVSCPIIKCRDICGHLQQVEKKSRLNYRTRHLSLIIYDMFTICKKRRWIEWNVWLSIEMARSRDISDLRYAQHLDIFSDIFGLSASSRIWKTCHIWWVTGVSFDNWAAIFFRLVVDGRKYPGT